MAPEPDGLPALGIWAPGPSNLNKAPSVPSLMTYLFVRHPQTQTCLAVPETVDKPVHMLSWGGGVFLHLPGGHLSIEMGLVLENHFSKSLQSCAVSYVCCSNAGELVSVLGRLLLANST